MSFIHMHRKPIVIFFAVCVVIAGVLIGYQNFKRTTNPDVSRVLYQSEPLGFEVMHPHLNFTPRAGGVVFHLPDGEIVINRSGVNTSSIEEYIDQLIEINHLKVISRTTGIIDEVPAIKLVTKNDPNDIISYFIISGSWAYRITGGSRHADYLDGIVQTFHVISDDQTSNP